MSFAQMFVKGGAMFLTSCAWFFYDLFYDFSMIYYALVQQRNYRKLQL